MKLRCGYYIEINKKLHVFQFLWRLVTEMQFQKGDVAEF